MGLLCLCVFNTKATDTVTPLELFPVVAFKYRKLEFRTHRMTAFLLPWLWFLVSGMMLACLLVDSVRHFLLHHGQVLGHGLLGQVFRIRSDHTTRLFLPWTPGGTQHREYAAGTWRCPLVLAPAPVSPSRMPMVVGWGTLHLSGAYGH